MKALVMMSFLNARSLTIATRLNTLWLVPCDDYLNRKVQMKRNVCHNAALNENQIIKQYQAL